MKEVWIFSALLIVGLTLSQVLPGVLGEHADPVRAAVAVLSESIHWGSLAVDRSVPIHLEVLLPAFALAYRLGGPLVAVALLSLALNLLLTGAFILIVKRLLADNAPVRAAEGTVETVSVDKAAGPDTATGRRR